MLRYLVVVFGLIALLVFQAQAEPSAKAARLIDALSDALASEIQSGKSSEKAKSRSPSGAITNRRRHRVVIFTNDKGQVEPLLSAIKRRGFHTKSHVNDDPNDDWNIKWGSASSRTIDEVLALVDAEMGIPAERLRKSHEFEANDTDIFINLKF